MSIQSGHEFEIAAAKFLQAAKLNIIARGVRSGRYEVDLLALEYNKRGVLLIFVEARFRRSANPHAALDCWDQWMSPRKERNFSRAVALLLPHWVPRMGADDYRVDAIFGARPRERGPMQINWIRGIL